jgi:hypothetical protein
MAENKMQTCNWLKGWVREVGRAYLVPALESRRNRMQGRPYYLLTNLRTYLDFQRKGAAITLVQWSIKRDELRIPAYHKASNVSNGLYAKPRFKKVDVVKTVIDGGLVEEYPAMLREASSTSE